MKFIFKLTAAICPILLIMLLCACSETKSYRIGVSQCSSDDWRDKMNEEILREVMLHDNVDVEIRSAEGNNDKQIKDLEYFASNHFDIIIAAPNEAEPLTAPVKKIYESGIPIILFDRTINGDSFTAFQGADNAEIGRLAAKMAQHLAGKSSRIIEIRGLKGSSPEIGRHEGFNKTASEMGMSVEGSGYGDWNADRGAIVADSLLRLYPDANVIYAHNDRMAIAAAEVARSLHRDNIKIIGIDAAPKIGIKAVKDSVIDATFLYPTAGGQLIRTAIAILENAPYDKNLILPSPSAVDANNAELLLLQDNALREETGKIEKLKSQLDEFWQQHSLQTTLLYGTVIILLLFTVVIFLLIRAYWMNKRHRLLMEERNKKLAAQKDELDDLYKRLQEATSSKLTFFTNVSHDLRTPLTLIAEPVAQLANANNLTPQQRTQMDLANKNVKRLMRLINQILDIRKHDASRLELHLQNIELAAALKEWCRAFGDAARKRHLQFSTDLEQASGVITAVDIEKIERVLFNLISNAFKFTPANGKITVSLKRAGNNLQMTVSDTGCGIPQDEIRSIFDRFFKTDHINPTGSGIGLALSKVFVEMHAGAIEVESTPGVGTSFIVTLPIREIENSEKKDLSRVTRLSAMDAEELAVIDEVEPAADEDSPTVLIIDDNSDIRILMKSILGEKYTVIQAASGAEGIRKASKFIPDLVICDVMMPGMDGYETCRSLKGEVVTSHIPVLLLTACTQDEQRTQGYECGADGYMSKPFESGMLLARCESLIENRKRILTVINKNANTVAAAQTQKSPKPEGDIDNEFYNRFVAVVNEELSNSEITVEDIADRLGLSRVQMYRKLKAITNYSPTELLRNLRLERAAILLKTTEANISEIAYSTGFSAPNHFTKCYKQYFGELPSETQNRTSKKH